MFSPTLLLCPFRACLFLIPCPESPGVARGWHVVPFQGEIQDAQHQDLHFRLVVSAFPGIVCFLDVDRPGAPEFVQ